MVFLRVLFILLPTTLLWGQSYWDYMIHPEQLSWPLEGNVAHFSSWARNGSNSDLGYYYGVAPDGYQKLCDIDGPGVVTAMWWTQDNTTPAWRWRLYVDNMSTAVIDTPLAAPFGEMHPFLPPLADSSSGGYYSYVPIPFQNHLRITYNDAWDIYFHVTVLKLPAGTQVESFTMPPSPQYLAMLDSLSDRLATPATPIYVPTDHSYLSTGTLAVGQSVTVFDQAFSGMTRRMLLRLQNRTQSVFENFWVRVYTDGYPIPDIEGPLSVAFATPIGWRIFQSVYAGKSGDSLYFNWPVVSDRHLKIELENRTPAAQPYAFKLESANSDVGPFRLTGQYREANPTRLWENYDIADFKGAGNFVGTVQDMQQPDNHVLEGDELFYIDGETSPTWHGTGTEDYFKGGRYWTPVYTQLPLHGCVAYLADTAAAYRWHNNDPIPFRTSLHYDTEVGRFNNLAGHYRTMAYAYLERPKWRALDESGDAASHAGETIRVVGAGIDPQSFIFGAQLGDYPLALESGSFLFVNGDSIFDATFALNDTMPIGNYPLLVWTDAGYDTVDAQWEYLGGPTLWFRPVRVDIGNIVTAGDTLDIELHGVNTGETATVSIDGLPCPWAGAIPAADNERKLTGRVRVPEGLYEGDYAVATATETNGTATADSLLHYRNWFRLEPEILRYQSWSGARIKEEWCRDWIMSNNIDPWGRMAAYVLTGNAATSFVTLPFWAPNSGSYRTACFIARTSNAAHVSVEINGQPALPQTDMYLNTQYQSWQRSDTLWGNTVNVNQGYNTVTLRTPAKNNLSSGWKAIFDQMLFIASVPDAPPARVQEVTILVESDSLRLEWLPVTTDINGQPLMPLAYDIYLAQPDDSAWAWQTEVSGTETTCMLPLTLGSQFNFAVVARRGSFVPSSVPRNSKAMRIE